MTTSRPRPFTLALTNATLLLTPALALGAIPVCRKKRWENLPRKFYVGAGGMLALLCVATVFGRQQEPPRAAVEASQEPGEFVISAEEMDRRSKEIPPDFHPRKMGKTPPSSGAVTEPALDPLDIRRARRQNDPEDLIRQRDRGAGGKSSTEARAQPEAPRPDGPLRHSLFPAPTIGADAFSTDSASGMFGGGGRAPVLGSGTVVPAVLVTPIDLASSSASVIAKVEPGSELPAGSRFIGTVSGSSDGRLSLRFTKILLAGGRELRVQAEAQALDGSFGLMGSVQEEKPEEPSVAGEVAKDTATDVIFGALGGIAGDAARNYSRRSAAGSSWSRAPSARVTLAAGTTFQVFIHEAVGVGALMDAR